MIARVQFTQHNWRWLKQNLIRLADDLRHWAWLTCFLFASVLPNLASANNSESLRVLQPIITEAADGAWLMDAQVEVGLSPVLIDAVKRGVPLYFVSEFELSRDRWYWFDQKLAVQSKTVRITYHALTQQFRIAVGGLHQTSYASLDEALSGALRVRGWQVLDAQRYAQLGGRAWMEQNKTSIVARFRVRLDSALLPKPLQVDALTSRDWKLTTDWIDLALPADPAASFFILKGSSP